MGALGGLAVTSCFPGLPRGGDGGRSVTVRTPASGLELRISGHSRAWPEPLEAWTLGPVAPGAHPALPAAEAGKSLRNGAPPHTAGPVHRARPAWYTLPALEQQEGSGGLREGGQPSPLPTRPGPGPPAPRPR